MLQSRLLVAVAACFAATCAYAQPATVPAAPAQVAPDRDLRTIAEALLPAGTLEAIAMQGVDVVLRTKRERNPEWQAMERQYPGIGEASLQATHKAALAELPAMTAALQADAIAYFNERLTATERARFAAYLRHPFPQRMAHLHVDARPGETMVQALQRATKAMQASASAAEIAEDQHFYTSPVGRKCNMLAAEFNARADAKQGEVIVPILKTALAAGEQAGIAFVEAHRPH